jgi:hypothetical protein
VTYKEREGKNIIIVSVYKIMEAKIQRIKLKSNEV